MKRLGEIRVRQANGWTIDAASVLRAKSITTCNDDTVHSEESPSRYPVLPDLNPENEPIPITNMNDIKPISDADKLGFVAGARAVSEWSHSVNRHNGFWEELELLLKTVQEHAPELKEKMVREIVLGRIALNHSEQSEGVEGVRKHDPSTWSSTEKDSFVSEMAGTVVRIMDLCEWLGVPLAEAIVAEINRNEKRGWKHGGKSA